MIGEAQRPLILELLFTSVRRVGNTVMAEDESGLGFRVHRGFQARGFVGLFVAVESFLQTDSHAKAKHRKVTIGMTWNPRDLGNTICKSMWQSCSGENKSSKIMQILNEEVFSY